METYSVLPVPGEFTAQRPATRSFDVFFDLHPNKRLSEQWWGRCLRRHRAHYDVTVMSDYDYWSRYEGVSVAVYKKKNSTHFNLAYIYFYTCDYFHSDPNKNGSVVLIIPTLCFSFRLGNDNIPWYIMPTPIYTTERGVKLTCLFSFCQKSPCVTALMSSWPSKYKVINFSIHAYFTKKTDKSWIW